MGPPGPARGPCRGKWPSWSMRSPGRPRCGACGGPSSPRSRFIWRRLTLLCRRLPGRVDVLDRCKVTRLWFSPISGTSSGSAPRRKKRRTVHEWHSPQALASTQGRSLHPAGVCRVGAVGWDGLQAGLFENKVRGLVRGLVRRETRRTNEHVVVKNWARSSIFTREEPRVVCFTW